MVCQLIENKNNSTLIDEIKNLVIDQFEAMDSLIRHYIDSDIPLIEEISKYLINSGGKRLRPLIVLLVANALGYQGSDHVCLAAIVEFLHTATLLHDDVVDNSTLRRGKQTANLIWGNAASVLVGDYLYARIFEILTGLKNIQIMDTLAKTTSAIAEGEVLQLVKRNDPTTDEAHYMKVISYKTARLFQAAAQIATMICQRPVSEQTQMASFGFHLGMAFQLVDDALDYMGSPENLGKNVGDDLAEGKPTLPLIYAMHHTCAKKSEMIKDAIRSGGVHHLTVILEAIQETKALDYTFKKAQEQSELALNALSFLEESTYTTALKSLAHFTVQRVY